MKKRIISFLLAILLMMLSLDSVCFAIELPQYIAQSKNVNVGDQFEIDVSIENNPGIISLRFSIEYDSEKIQLLEIDNSNLLNGYTNPSPSVSSPYILRWADSLAISDNARNGVVATLKFIARSEGESEIKIIHQEARNTSLTKIAFSDTSSMISVLPAPIHVTGIELDKDVISVKTGNTVTLTPTLSPDTATNKNVTWTSSAEDVASVENGVVSGIKKGTATITVKTEDGNFEASCVVTVECSHTNTTVHPAESSTCLKQGHAEYYTCDACGEVTSGSDELLPLGDHTGGTATCKDKAICDVCHQSYGGYGSHTLTPHARNEADHYNAGNIQYWTCDVCNKFFSDSEGKVEISEKDTVLEVIPHSYSKDWSKNDLKHWKECSCGDKIEVADHSYDNDCDTTCNVCGYKRSITHSYQLTWSTDEENHWHECSVCHDKKDLGKHIDGNTDGKCDTCGYVLCILGDVTGDGNIDAKDLTRLKKYLADKVNTEISHGADCTGDGNVDAKDLTRIKKYLADKEHTVLGKVS